MTGTPLTHGNLDASEQIRSALEERIEQRVLRVPLLPRVAERLLALAHDPKADAASLASLIHQDLALASQVLRIANSVAFLPRTPIVSLQQAVAWLGTDVLLEIAATISLQNDVFHVEGYEEDVKQIWRQALVTALCGREIARLRPSNVDQAFLCGLLHTIGKPAVLHALIALQKELGVQLTSDAVHVLMGRYHTTVGILLADKWNLPPQVREAIAYYHDYGRAPSATEAAKVTCLADRLAVHFLQPDRMSKQSVRSHAVVQDLSLSADNITALLSRRDTVLRAMESMIL